MRTLWAIVLSTMTLLITVTSPARAADGDPEPEQPNVGLRATGPAAKANGYYVIDSAPGAVADLPFVVTNPTGLSETATIYAVDARTMDGGGMQPTGPDVTASATGAWLHPDPSVGVVTLGPHEQRQFQVKLAVPADAGTGQHVAAILARVTSAGQAKTGSTDSVALAVSVVRQVMIGVQITLPGLIQHELHAVAVDHFYRGDTLFVRPRLENTGNAIERPALHVTVKDGTKVMEEKTLNLDSIYPGTIGTATIEAKSIQGAGTYSVTVETTTAEVSDRRTFDLTIPRAEARAADAVRYDLLREQHRTDDVVLLTRDTLMRGAAAAGGVALIVGFIVRLRRRNVRGRPRPLPPTDGGPLSRRFRGRTGAPRQQSARG